MTYGHYRDANAEKRVHWDDVYDFINFLSILLFSNLPGYHMGEHMFVTGNLDSLGSYLYDLRSLPGIFCERSEVYHFINFLAFLHLLVGTFYVHMFFIKILNSILKYRYIAYPRTIKLESFYYMKEEFYI